MSDKEMPDGWVAWHRDEREELIYNSRTYGARADLVAALESIPSALNPDTFWRIRPVKLLFLDEDK